MEKLYFFTKSEKIARDLAARLAATDRQRRPFAIFTGNGARLDFDGRGNLESRTAEEKHFDALEIMPTMTEKQLTNARTRAQQRKTVRERENAAAALLARLDELTAAERLDLLHLVSIAYHDSGKIEGCNSIDSCAACAFCQKMIAAAAVNILVICGCCYAAADAWKEAAWRTHQVNARILSTVLFTREELATLEIGPRCRFNEDGDTINETHARNLLRIGLTHPGTSFGYWYKNAPAVGAGLAAEGITTREQLPDNIRFIHSSALIGFPVRPSWFDDATFTVYPDAESLQEALAAGAHECNGRRCRACGYFCYLAERRPEPVNIAEFLRVRTEKDREKYIAAYREQRARMEARKTA